MFLEALQDILVDHAGSAAIRAIEAGGRGVEVWQPIEDAGFLALMLPESQGGAALPLSELFPILDCLGRHALPLPVAQSIVARALVGEGAELPPGMLTLGLQWQRQPDGGMACLHTPAGMVAEHVLVADTDRLLLLALSDARREPVGDPRSLVAHLYWREARPVQEWVAGGTSLAAHAAALTAAQLSGAMQRIFAMALDQCNTRVQFGKSISKFQAVQQQLSVMAEHVLAASIAAEAAFRSDTSTPRWLAAAVAKSRASEAAGLVAATAHAVHGAIGMTDEFDLGLLTRRLHAWRMQYGAEQVWNQQIGEQLLDCGRTLAEFVREV
jgi:acyl-CoA dehydrogenase